MNLFFFSRTGILPVFHISLSRVEIELLHTVQEALLARNIFFFWNNAFVHHLSCCQVPTDKQSNSCPLSRRHDRYRGAGACVCVGCSRVTDQFRSCRRWLHEHANRHFTSIRSYLTFLTRPASTYSQKISHVHVHHSAAGHQLTVICVPWDTCPLLFGGKKNILVTWSGVGTEFRITTWLSGGLALHVFATIPGWSSSSIHSWCCSVHALAKDSMYNTLSYVMWSLSNGP